MSVARILVCAFAALSCCTSLSGAVPAIADVPAIQQGLSDGHSQRGFVNEKTRHRRQEGENAAPAQQQGSPATPPQPDPAVLQKEIDELKADLEGARQSASSKEQQFLQANAEKQVLENQSNQLRQELANAMAEKQRVEGELSSQLSQARTQCEADKEQIRQQVQALQGQMQDLEKQYQEALETFPDLTKWFGKHMDTYVSEEVKSHAAKYNPLISTVTEKTAEYTSSLKDGLEQRLSGLMPQKIGAYAPIMAWTMTYGVFLIPMVACFFIFFKVTTSIPVHKLLLMCHLFYAIFFAILFVNTIILGQDALLVEADAYHDAVESMLFMMGMGYIFSATLQTYQLLTLRRQSVVAIVSYASVIAFQYLSLGFMYRFMWKRLARSERWHWPAKHIYLLMCLMYTAFVILVAYIRDGSSSGAPRRLQDLANESTVSVQMDTHRMEEGATRIAEMVDAAAHGGPAPAKQD